MYDRLYNEDAVTVQGGFVLFTCIIKNTQNDSVRSVEGSCNSLSQTVLVTARAKPGVMGINNSYEAVNGKCSGIDYIIANL